MAKKEKTIENKLRSLFDLQLIDSRIDEIRSVRGELPLEVEDLEKEIYGLQTRLNEFKLEYDNFQNQIAHEKNNIETIWDSEEVEQKMLALID